MGNCLNPASKRLGGGAGAEMMTKEEAESLAAAKRMSQLATREEEFVEEEEQEEKAASAAAAGPKVKVVLTRAELEWLMAQLKAGERSLAGVLRDLHAVKAAVALAAARADKDGGGWRPRLESIVECPEH